MGRKASMYVNKCSKCGAEFETKNPKRVICPGCLYPERKPILNSFTPGVQQETPSESTQVTEKPDQPQQAGTQHHSAHYGDGQRPPQGGYPQGQRPQQGQRPPYGGQRPPQGGGGFRRPPQGGYPQGQRPPQGGGGFRRPPQGGGFRRPPQGGGNFRRPPGVQKKLLISREQVEQIENLYKKMLPLPNPDVHEVIGKEINLEPNKVFFGINLVRQKMMLPKLPYPKRKLAVSPDQLMAIQSLYMPLLPLPPIGCHKFISKQLKMDEWRVHVGIGIIRKQMELPRWNVDREDAPAEFKKQKQEELASQEAVKTEE